jgi:D-glucuronyl C5-epimerase C-terminus
MKSKFKTCAFILFTLVFIVFCNISCGRNEPIELKNNDYSFLSLDYNDLFYTYPEVYYQIFDPFNYVMDSNGVVLAQYGDLWYHNPVTISQKGINFFDRYRKVNDSLYLDYTNIHRDALINIMNEVGFFEYRMNYHHFDIYFFNPWYSGMAQGQALSLLSRLAFYADDTLSEALAHKIFQTLDPYSKFYEVEFIDNDHYAWIEEYPANSPDHTFNGFMFAIIGIYDYYHLLKPDEETRDILSAYLTTVHDYMHEYRNPGTISKYCLRHNHTDTIYHRIHVLQLDYFTKITQDSSFSLFADTLEMDYWNY